MKETYLGVNVSNLTYSALIEAIFADINKKKKSMIVAINPEKVMKAQDDPELKKLLNRADYQVPDGIGVVLASKLKGGKIKQRVTGIDMMLNLCEEAAERGKKVFLYGAKPGIAEEAKQELIRKYPNLQVSGTLDGYEKDETKIIETINEGNPDIIFVALGSPRQEYWILDHLDKISPSIFQGVGGSFDVISGRINRAPEIFMKFGLEWLYRLVKEPWRWKRQIVIPKFLIRVLMKK
ncbi:glycosyltransferase [Lottiidibacillus patelloidae]|uniref:N-acetylglucosaminyldiphosphoundecaprenol N-acetyl-beta-D-mannosaminyltransferase n=1 Tax=Lottiidibacillus patelloidae TaxID=2670334 RepID=A0A263BSU9_9BACI|nr:WecB/TagA/CpsF family glycosyltransferase [Lottiidibacillus patelloidae]OZM56652.1 glycosyltransferase [Lottiidibacillus patelloidae]